MDFFQRHGGSFVGGGGVMCVGLGCLEVFAVLWVLWGGCHWLCGGIIGFIAGGRVVGMNASFLVSYVGVGLTKLPSGVGRCGGFDSYVGSCGWSDCEIYARDGLFLWLWVRVDMVRRYTAA
jgi:hypothetical protein